MKFELERDAITAVVVACAIVLGLGIFMASISVYNMIVAKEQQVAMENDLAARQMLVDLLSSDLSDDIKSQIVDSLTSTNDELVMELIYRFKSMEEGTQEKIVDNLTGGE